MALLIDPPVWPAHGTVWSHLVSDHSYEELHVFARGVGIPRRGFDLDHYDVPARLYRVTIVAGAEAVESRVLLHRLRVSGLRVRHVDRAEASRRHRLAFLRAEWAELGTRLPARTPPDAAAGHSAAWHSLGERLLARWSEAHRHYHDLLHLHEVLLSLDQLADLGEPVPPSTLLAAWFHDAVYDGAAGEDERRSAALARAELAAVGLPGALADEVAALVLATTPGSAVVGHAGRAGHAAQVLVDADRAILAAGPKRYAAYAAAVRAEYAHVPEDQFRRGRAAILAAFLAEPWLYGTPTARARWEERARANVAAEVAELTGWETPSGRRLSP